MCAKCLFLSIPNLYIVQPVAAPIKTNDLLVSLERLPRKKVL
jgi:hypothetical protein